MARSAPYDWLKQIPHSLLHLDEIPLTGFAPPFPWSQFAEELSRTLQVEGLNIAKNNQQWRTANKLYSGLGQQLVPVTVSFSGLEGALTWVLPQSEITKLMSMMISKEGGIAELLDQDYKTEFYRFLTLMTLNASGKIDFDTGLSPKIEETSELPNTDAFTTDVTISVGGTSVTGRVIIPPELASSWRERHTAKGPAALARSPLAKEIMLTVHLEAGKTQLKKSVLSRIKPGDFIVLDQCGYDPDSDRTKIMLTVMNIPLFRGKIKQGSIKILEYPLYHEATTDMDTNSDDEDMDEDSLFFDEESEEFPEMEEEFEDFEEEAEERSELEEEELTEQEREVSMKVPKGSLKPAGEPLPGGGAQQLATKEIPMTVVIEVGRLQMPLQKLLEMQPGNLLELDIRPEDGVDLVVNGKKIAKGELLRAGETLGVRVVELG